MAKRYCKQSINRKWRDNRLKLWAANSKPSWSKAQIMKHVPEGVGMDQWALYVEYRFKEKTKELCERNKEIRKMQIIPHTCGAKSLARRRHELEIKTGKSIGRGPMWIMSHTKRDGSYVNDKAKEIGETIENHLSQNLEAAVEISPNDVVGKILGPEHHGRVRGMGMGVVPTVAFKRTTSRLRGMSSGSPVASTSSVALQRKVVTLESQLQALFTFITTKAGGNVPEELAGLFPNSTPEAPDIGSGAQSPNDEGRSYDGSNTH